MQKTYYNIIGSDPQKEKEKKLPDAIRRQINL
jgi:hypothetical protein